MNESTAHLDGEKGGLVFDRANPFPIASNFWRLTFQTEAAPDGKPFPTLWFSGGLYYRWDGVCYKQVDPIELRKLAYYWLGRQVRNGKPKEDTDVVPFQPKMGDVNQLMDVLRSIAFARPEEPAWLGKDECPVEMKQLLVAKNGIFDLGSESNELFLPPTPKFFTTHALDYDYVPDAPPPENWLEFLRELWQEDQESIDLLQEWFGYCLTQETRFQKILMIIGPPRSGKGTIGRILRDMIGKHNSSGPTLTLLENDFGLEEMSKKTLAVFGDARLTGRPDQGAIVERLLSISGEDAITVNRKHREAITMTLLTRIVLISNELPKLGDASGAMANRFLILAMRESFLGREDHGLTDRLMAELPSILRWAIEGWRRLHARGYFIQPTSSRELLEDMNNLSSPISAFVRDCCVKKDGVTAPVAEMYDLWSVWCEQEGRDYPGNKATFAKDLRAVVPGLKTTQRRLDDGTRTRVFEGVGITLAGREMLRQQRATDRWSA